MGIGLNNFPLDPNVGHDRLFEIHMPDNQVVAIPDNAFQNFPRLLTADLAGNPLTSLGSNSLYAEKIYDNVTSLSFTFEDGQLTDLPDELFGPSEAKRKILGIDLKENALTELKENSFKNFLVTSLAYQGRFPFVMSVQDNPFSCCSLAWMYMEGKRYGEPYQEQVRRPFCGITEGITNEYMLWDMTCSDFIMCQTEPGLDNFVADCEATGPEPLPETTPGEFCKKTGNPQKYKCVASLGPSP